MQTARTHLNMNSDWAFYRGDVADGARIGLDDSGWIAASLPHIMQLEKKHCGGDIIYDGVGWYRRYFTLSEEYKEKRIVISFEGVMNACDVYMNEERVATHHGGYVGFVCDVSDAINWSGNNLLAVRVSAEHDPLTPPGKPQDRMDFYYYSGIYRDVEMVITDKLYVTDALEEDEVAGGGLFVTYPEVTKETARVHVKTQLRNHYETAKEGHLRTLLVDEKHKIITDQTTPFTLNANGNTTIEQDLTVDNPSLWHPYSPYLYGLRTEVVVDGEVVDDQYTPVGIRTIAYTTEDGFFINGEKLYLRGTNRHQAYQNVGDAASNSMQERDVIDMKRGGFNAVRAAHYPQDPAFLDACDKYGLLVVECIPGWQYFLNDSTFINRLYEVGRQMIRRDRNHPSVVLWETALNESRYPVELAKDLFDIAHAEYPGDQMYTAGDYLGHADMEPYYDVFYKQVSKYPKDGNVMSNYLEDQVAVKPLFTREWGDGAGEKPRVSLLENEEEQMKQCRSRFRQLNGDGYFDWCMLDANPRMGGHFMWSYNDYARGSQEETLFCGVVDINRYPKFSYYMSQSMRAHSISQKGLYEGPMVYIASYNAGEEYVSSTTDITVFSNCEEVKLYRNGKLVGKKTRDGSAPSYQSIVDKGGSPCFIFDAGSYEAGELKAEAFVGGKRVATHRVRTPEEAHHIEVVVHDAGIQPIADGSDMVPVYFKICDKNGTLVNSSRAVIDIQVSGEGALIGGGIERIGVSPQEVEGGIGYGFIRTTKKAGKITITATSEGLEAGTAHVYSQPFSGNYVADGTHGRFHGNEEDGVVVKQSAWERQVSAREPLPVAEVIVSGAQKDYPASHITDGNDKSWWIADSDVYPQVVTIGLKEAMRVLACRIVFQKDSSYYTHKIEVSRDGENWMQLYEREVTGWEFKPLRINRTIKYLRITIENVSEGRAGIGEVTLY
ncbi:DUF4982 domain-containing protein [Parabacteroides sp. OttesenSCG-928-G06]|nr:DUF4982 domain-containing protein [Parabacteroides sp. OttesenSCG-928-K15]MDL2281864.1 DUF4982 domain-containing protein [Parabacteroides sp. OttesenSCG-928-G06]